MTDIDLDALEATARASTPGPWHRGAHYIGAGGEPHDPETHVGQASVLQDARHIAAFDPPTALALIARLREAEAVIEEVRANAVELLDADDDSYDGSLSAIWAVELIDAYKTTKTENGGTPKRRLRSCVEQWPECETGDYDPACCRFPKSCSATVYDDDRVTDADLEPVTDRENGAP